MADLDRLYSKVFFEIPSVLDVNEYRDWIDFEVLKPWLVGVGAKHYETFSPDCPTFEPGDWELEGGLNRVLGYDGAKCHKYDGESNVHNRFLRSKGVMIREHDSPHDVIKVHAISDSFEHFLQEQNIPYSRVNYEK